MIGRQPISPSVALPTATMGARYLFLLLWQYAEVTFEGPVVSMSNRDLIEASGMSRSMFYAYQSQLLELGAIRKVERKTSTGVIRGWLLTPRDLTPPRHGGISDEAAVRDTGLGSPGFGTDQSGMPDSVRDTGPSLKYRTQSEIPDRKSGIPDRLVRDTGPSPKSRTRPKTPFSGLEPPKSRLEQNAKPFKNLTPVNFVEINQARIEQGLPTADPGNAPNGATHKSPPRKNSKPHSDVCDGAAAPPANERSGAAVDRRAKSVDASLVEAVVAAYNREAKTLGVPEIQLDECRSVVVRATLRERATLEDWQLRIANQAAKIRSGLDSATWFNLVHIGSASGWAMHRVAPEAPGRRRTSSGRFIPSGNYDEARRAQEAAQGSTGITPSTTPERKTAGADPTPTGGCIDFDDKKPF